MEGHNFERALVAVMTEMAEKKGFKHKPLAIAAWGKNKDPGTKWRKIRNGTDPRGLQVQDAYDLAMAMGVSFVELCGMAQAKVMHMDGPTAPSTQERSRFPQATGIPEAGRSISSFGDATRDER